MAAKSKAKPKSRKRKPAAKSSKAAKSRKAARRGRKAGAIKYTPEMRQALMDEVKKADKAGLTRASVYAKMADRWNKKGNGHTYTAKQVGSTFLEMKQRMGYNKLVQPKKRPKRTKTHMAVEKATPDVIVSNFKDGIKSLEEALNQARAEADEANKRADELAAKLEAVRNAAA